MGLHRTAHYLQSKGRGEDTELVHMTKDEVKGLQELALAHGGTLTINPDTGLVEAGFLSRMLPTVAGIAAGAITMNPMVGAAVAGGLTMATGGSLTQGLLAGVSAYGGAGMFSSLAEAGATQAAAEGASEATQAAATQAAQPAAQIANTGAASAAQGSAASNIDPALLESMSAKDVAAYNTIQSMPNLPQGAATGIQSTIPQVGSQQALETAGRVNATANMSPMQAAGRGITSMYNTPGATTDFIKNNMTNVGMLAAPMLAGGTNQPQGAYVPAGGSNKSSISPNFQAYVPDQPNPYYRPKYPTYAAQGGIMQSYAGGGPVEQMTQNMMGGASNMYPQSQQEHTNFATPTQMPASAEVIRSDYDAKTDPYSGQMVTMAAGGLPEKQDYLPKGDAGVFHDTDPSTKGLSALDATTYKNKKLLSKFGIPMAQMPKTGIKSLGGDFSDVGAAGGTASIGGYSDGGRMLKGPGDGMSDSIPATIGNKQPARLADGEFVVPADVVSHLGNGSTDAGAKRLYSMMDKIRKARTGKKKQAPAVKADKYLPA